jgi:hypothetical protein
MSASIVDMWQLSAQHGWIQSEDPPPDWVQTVTWFEKPSGRSIEPDRWVSTSKHKDQGLVDRSLALHGPCPGGQ